MFTINYNGAYIHGYCDKALFTVSCCGISNRKVFKSYLAAQIAISKALKTLHGAGMVNLYLWGNK